MSKRKGEELVGEIGVDAGLCWVGDPSYVLPRKADADAGLDYDEMLERIWASYEKTRVAKLKVGVCVSTGYGDGSYPVYVKRSAEGRITEARVEFINTDGES